MKLSNMNVGDTVEVFHRYKGKKIYNWGTAQEDKKRKAIVIFKNDSYLTVKYINEKVRGKHGEYNESFTLKGENKVHIKRLIAAD